jgi:hypothetical protein
MCMRRLDLDDFSKPRTIIYTPIFLDVFCHIKFPLCASFIKMVDWDDPVVLEKDYCTFPDQFISPMLFRPSYTSGCHQARSCCCWYLHVRSLSYTWMHKAISTHKSLSWETILTADFELDVLRGKKPYRWTIWVSLLCCYRVSPPLKLK